MTPMRTRILNAAIHLFAQGDYRAATIRDICAVAQCSIGAIYDHFQNKKDLFRQALRTEAKPVKSDLIAGAKLNNQKLRARKLAKACYTNVPFMRLLLVDDQMHIGEGKRLLRSLAASGITESRLRHIERALKRAAGMLRFDALFEERLVNVDEDLAAWTEALFVDERPDGTLLWAT